jgi:hypothetical protein
MADKVARNVDELAAMIEADDLADAQKLTPREYGRMRGISPQLVYYHLRVGNLDRETCICGRKVIDVKLADEFFNKDKVDRDE